MISLVCPSRGRPELAERMVNSVLKDPGCEVEIMLYLNDNDPTLEEYVKRLDPTHYQIGVDRSPAYSWNMLANTAKHDIIFLMGDDAQVQTPNWGVIVKSVFDRFPDKIAMVAPKAEGLGNSKCPHFFLHRNWINTLGYFVPPQFHLHYVDHWCRDVAKSVGRYCHMPDFVMPIIASVGDDTMKRYQKTWLKERDLWIWENSERHKSADAIALKNFIQNYKGY
jgi:hypothetical protein